MRRLKAFGILEVMIASTIMVTVIGAAVGLGVLSVRSTETSSDKSVAYNLAQEGLEMVRGMRDSAWVDETPQSSWDSAWSATCPCEINKDLGTATNGTCLSPCNEYGIDKATGALSKASGAKKVEVDLDDAGNIKREFTREISIENVSWYNNVNLGTTSPYLPAVGKAQDKIIKKVVVKVSWTNDYNHTQSVKLETYLSDWKSME